MRIGRILYPVSSLGPGKRLGIWVQGCGRSCEGCANPELQPMDIAKEMPLDIVILMARTAITLYGLDGISITGGEPMLQAGELSDLVSALSDICSDVLVFSGFTLEELQGMNDNVIDGFLSKISVLVDGPYIKDRNRGEKLRGSDNQRIHFLDRTTKELYLSYLSSENRVADTFIADNGVIAVGIHPQDFSVKAEEHKIDYPEGGQYETSN